MNIFRTKAIEIDRKSDLKRVLGPVGLVGLGIGAIIGTGIFVLTGLAAANHAGPALVVSFVMAAIACTLAALCYAELAAMIPVSGSAYSYAYATLGEGIAWFVGWFLMFEYLLAAATVAVGWSGYAGSLAAQLGVPLPHSISEAPFIRGANGVIVASGSILNLPAVLIVAVLTGLCYVGMQRTSTLNSIVVAVKLMAILLFIAFGIGYVDPANWHPFIPANQGPGRFGWDGIGQAAAIVFFAYIGFDAVSTAAQEARNPQRDMPIGILGSLIVCTILYIAVSAVLTGMAHYTQLGGAAPIAFVLDQHASLAWLGFLIKIGAVAGMTSVILVTMLAQSRIFFAMSRDGLLPPVFSRVHPRFQTPVRATLITGVLAGAVAGLFPVNVLGELVSFGTLSAFLVVCIGVLVLRRTRPDLKRHFRVPSAPLVCSGGAFSCAYLLYKLPADTWMRAGAWAILGALIYVLHGSRNSVLNRPQ